jgi:hypothetical protein
MPKFRLQVCGSLKCPYDGLFFNPSRLKPTHHLSFRLGWGIMLMMQEVLSRTGESKLPLQDRVYYELRLYDSESAGEPVCCVRQARAHWDEESQEMARDEVSVEAFATLKEAKERYAERRLALAQKGFTDSDMDLF